MIDYQFYPSDPILANRAFGKFSGSRIIRLLDPSAGRADLLLPAYQYLGGKSRIDCVEIDLDNQAILRSNGFRVVGTDFLKFKSAAIYSHILMNPPFNVGARHVIHAWNIVSNAEIVAIINAETLKDPFSAERQHLVKLLEDHAGSEVEYIKHAFLNPDTQRRTNVEVALIHLVKRTASKFDTSYLAQLHQEKRREFGEDADYSEGRALMLPYDELQSRVIDFECAVDAMVTKHDALARYTHLSRRLGHAINSDTDEVKFESIEADRNKGINEDYDKLKAAAWSGIMKSTSVTKRISTNVAARIEQEFEHIRQMEFSMENIFAFIDGLVAQTSVIQSEVMCEVFDRFSRYHTGNRCYYRSWKSNDKHRTQAHRLKMSRFVIPGVKRYYEGRSKPDFAWEDKQKFTDMDKAFALLDGKTPETIQGFEWALRTHVLELWRGERVSMDYFDLRFYPGVGTFHIYPKRKDLVDRLNDVVGRHRQWLPHDASQATPAFWAQYDQAELVASKLSLKGVSLQDLEHNDGHGGEVARASMATALREAQLKVGIDYQPEQLEYQPASVLMIA